MQVPFRSLMLIMALFFVNLTFAQPRPTPPPKKEEMIKHLKEKLDLSDSQVKKVDLILSSNQKRIEEILNKQDQEIVKILNDKQKKEFTQMKKERENGPHSDEERPAPPRK